MHHDDPTVGEDDLAAIAERQQRELARLADALAEAREALERTELRLEAERAARIEDLARVAVLRHELQAAKERPSGGEAMVTALARVLRDERAAMPAPRTPVSEEELVRRSSYFDPAWYLARNPDVAAAGVDPVHHFVLHGAAEGRSPGPRFDTAWYVATNPDAVGANPLVHFLVAGCLHGRLPAPPAADAHAP